MRAEGWYQDPFESHEARWFSAGRPTNLVRDQGVDSYDAPPAPEWTGPLTPVDTPTPVNGEDLKRADEPVRERGVPGLDGSGAMGIGFN
ncbi:hypothetical protein [Dactylosporangium sp. NPDC051541]|uniref:hypothetical protein n=1 Tax=Dactylosporangium sp. NPDC051541 TaxID=3363977 RepID=UPI003787B156